MDSKELKMLQALPLEVKVMKSKLRIEEWIRYYGEEGVYIGYSGGKDSTVLLHLVRSIYPNINAVFVNTGLEYPEIVEHVKTTENVMILRPDMNFKQVIETYGYPMVSKEQAQYLHELRTTKSEKLRNLRLNGDSKGSFKLAKKWNYLIEAPFKISHKCCGIMKKNPLKKYERETKKVPIMGTIAEESLLRLRSYLSYGCNAFDTKTPRSTPLGFWTEQDILRYIVENQLKIASVYGDIIEVDGKLKTTKCDRTGCVFCGFGCHLENVPNRYQRLEITHPQLHKYCMENLGFKEVCEYMQIPYSNSSENRYSS